uniref:Uncharacterized protein n=1 Tax=viral metagenome TaxID=1070528 RepID=A0A6C0BKP1_9ZZZZ
MNRLIDILCCSIPELSISLDYTDRCDYIYIPLASSIQASIVVTDLTQNEIMELLMNFNSVRVSSIEHDSLSVYVSHSEGITSIQDLYPLIIRKTLRLCREGKIDYMSIAEDLFNLVIAPNIRFGWDEDCVDDREVIIGRLLRDIEINFNQWLLDCVSTWKQSSWQGSDESQSICDDLNAIALSDSDLEITRRYGLLVQDVKIIGRSARCGRIIFNDVYSDTVINLRARDDYEVCDLMSNDLMSKVMSVKILKCLRDMMV